MWLGEWPFGQADGTSSAAAPCLHRLDGHGLRPVEVGQRHVAGGQQARSTEQNSTIAAVVGTGGAVRRARGRDCSRAAKRPLWNVLKIELAGEPEQVERPRPVLGDEAPGRREVLARHDLGRLVRPVLGRSVPRPHPLEVEGPPGAVVVRAGCSRSLHLRFGVVDQPGRPLHDVGVGVVHDPTFDVRHGTPRAVGSPFRLSAAGQCTGQQLVELGFHAGDVLPGGVLRARARGPRRSSRPAAGPPAATSSTELAPCWRRAFITSAWRSPSRRRLSSRDARRPRRGPSACPRTPAPPSSLDRATRFTSAVRRRTAPRRRTARPISELSGPMIAFCTTFDRRSRTTRSNELSWARSRLPPTRSSSDQADVDARPSGSPSRRAGSRS